MNGYFCFKIPQFKFMRNNNLYVVTTVFNPEGYRNRYELYNTFAKYIEDSGAILYTVELAIGNKPFHVTQADNPHHIQIRTKNVLWYKENLINIGIGRLPNDWEYMATIDADVSFTRHDWVKATIHELQYYKMIQMFTHANDLDSDYQVMKQHLGFVYAYNNKIVNNELQKAHEGVVGFQHPGYAWAYRRETIDDLKGLLDVGILGSADNYMALSLVGQVDLSLVLEFHPNYKKAAHDWQTLALEHIGKRFGYLKTHLNHYYHGSKKDRGYQTRWKILEETQFDPIKHLKKDSQGMLKLIDPKGLIEPKLVQYFKSRKEDK